MKFSILTKFQMRMLLNSDYIFFVFYFLISIFLIFFFATFEIESGNKIVLFGTKTELGKTGTGLRIANFHTKCLRVELISVLFTNFISLFN